jgi:hypothetical protein
VRPVTSRKIEVMKKEGVRLLTSRISRFKLGRTGEGADLSPGQGRESPVIKSRSRKPDNEVKVRKAR